MRGVDVTGKIFGRLTAIKRIRKTSGNHGTSYDCICSCGKLVRVLYSNLYTGVTKSCGCLRKDIIKKRQNPKQVIFRAAWNYYKRNASERGIKWRLSYARFKTLIQQPCHYCGMADSNLGRTSYGVEVRYNGVDRANNNRHYTKDNCRSCCAICNRAKATLTEAEYLNWTHRFRNVS